jgi:hypothetical protein
MTTTLTIDARDCKTRRRGRRRCTCKAYPFPHRTGGGLCCHPDPPAAVWQGRPGRHPPSGVRVWGSSIKQRLLKTYELHPIKDRAKIRRFLPKLYVAWCRRYGGPWAYWWLGGYVPAMRVIATGPPPGVEPYNGQDFWGIVLQGTERRWE